MTTDISKQEVLRELRHIAANYRNMIGQLERDYGAEIRKAKRKTAIVEKAIEIVESADVEAIDRESADVW